MGNDLVIPPPVTPGSWKLLLEAALPRKQYVAFGKMLASMDMHLQWAIGKWWLKGEREYGGGRALAEEMGFNYGTVTTYASVARKSSELKTCPLPTTKSSPRCLHRNKRRCCVKPTQTIGRCAICVRRL
jgi:hypothetical protein